MATEQAAPPTMTLDRSDGSATMDLYRAALGPVHTDGYLRAFTRFDAAGTSGPSWNWTAALLTLNWMLFRRLWLPALAYVGVLAAGLLLLLGIGRLLFQLPDTSLWALAGLGVLLAVVVPGAYGNAWLYAACNKAMTSALASSATLEETCAVLRKRTSGRPRLAGLAVGNLVLIAAVGALAWSWPGATHSGKLESAGAVANSGLVAASATASEAGVVASAPVASDAPAAPSRSSQGLVQPAPLPVIAASAPVVVASAPVAALVASAVTPVAVASQAGAVASAPAHAASVATAKASATAAPVKPSKAELQAKALEAKKEKLAKAKEAKEAKEAKSAKPAKDVKEKSVATTPAAAASAASNQYLINVGLFADANNARNAYAKLQDAGLPASIKELKSAKGPLTRVRAGPFDSEAEAERAAEKIRGLKLEAAVIKP